MNLSLVGRHALIGGGTRGIGFAAARELALSGAACTLIARKEEDLQRAVAALDTEAGQKHDYIVADYSHLPDLRKAVSGYRHLHEITILVNNTGGPKGGPITLAEEQAFLDAFQQHVINNQFLAQTLLPNMKAAGFGRIINVVSTSVRVPIHGLGVSNTIRAAVAGWAKTWSNEVASYGITVNNVLPGMTETDRLDSLISLTAKTQGLSERQIAEKMVQTIPARRFGKPGELGAAIAFLASPAASYITGVSLPVDGGRIDAI